MQHVEYILSDKRSESNAFEYFEAIVWLYFYFCFLIIHEEIVEFVWMN